MYIKALKYDAMTTAKDRKQTAPRKQSSAQAKFIYEIEKRVNATCTLLANCYRTPRRHRVHSLIRSALMHLRKLSKNKERHFKDDAYFNENSFISS